MSISALRSYRLENSSSLAKRRASGWGLRPAIRKRTTPDTNEAASRSRFCGQRRRAGPPWVAGAPLVQLCR